MIARALGMGAVVAAAVALAAPAEAKKMVYSPIVEEGEKEIEYYVDWRDVDGGEEVISHELAYEYGFAPRDMIALYGVWEGSPGEETFTKYKVEWIHQVFEQGERAWDFATYLEYQARDKGDSDKVEFKPLFEKTLPRSTVTLNGVFEKEIGAAAGGGTEAGYAARWALRVWPQAVPALEAFGGIGEVTDVKKWKEQGHIVGPVLDLQLGHFMALHVGALFGLTDGSEDVRVKSELAVEWY